MRIIKSQFIEELGAKLGITSSLAENAVNTFIRLIYEHLHNGDEVNLSGFGKFKISHRASRLGVNPRTKIRMTIPELNTPKFVSGEAFKEAVKLRPLT